MACRTVRTRTYLTHTSLIPAVRAQTQSHPEPQCALTVRKNLINKAGVEGDVISRFRDRTICTLAPGQATRRALTSSALSSTIAGSRAGRYDRAGRLHDVGRIIRSIWHLLSCSSQRYAGPTTSRQYPHSSSKAGLEAKLDGRLQDLGDGLRYICSGADLMAHPLARLPHTLQTCWTQVLGMKTQR